MLSRTAKFPALASCSVLVIEDSPQMRRIIRSMLHTLGVRRIAEAANGEAAVDQIHRRIPDLITLDYMMPGTDGLKVLANIRRRDAEWGRVPVLMVTGHASRKLIAAARDGGVNEILCKPFSLAMLAERVSTALHQPREFVDHAAYFGPDRRRRNLPRRGPERRRSETCVLAV